MRKNTRKNTRKTRRMKRRRGGATMQMERPRPSQAQPLTSEEELTKVLNNLTSTGGPDRGFDDIRRKIQYKPYADTVVHLRNKFNKNLVLKPLLEMLEPKYDRPNGQIINFNEGTLTHVIYALTDFKNGELDIFFNKEIPYDYKIKIVDFFYKKIKKSTDQLNESIKNYKSYPNKSLSGRRGGKNKRRKLSRKTRRKVKA